jgi:hypothetical protein
VPCPTKCRLMLAPSAAIVCATPRHWSRMPDTPLSRLLTLISAPWRVWLMVSVAGLLILMEAGRLIEQIQVADGHVLSLTDVVSPLAFAHQGAWQAWAAIGAEHSPGTLILFHTLADALFWIGYGMIGWRIFGVASTGRRLLATLIIAEAIEALSLTTAATLLLTGRSVEALGWLIVVVASVKWLATLGIIGYFIFGRAKDLRMRAGIAAALRGLLEQRLGLIVVATLGFLAVFPGGNILEQIPDIERAWLWLDEKGLAHVSGDTILRSGFVLSLVALTLFLFGRAKARRTGGAGTARKVDGPGVYVPWLAVSLGVLVVGGVLNATTRDIVDTEPLNVFVGITGGLALASLVIRLARYLFAPTSVLPGDRPRKRQPATYAEARRAGDALASSLIALASLGLLRSFSTPALIGAYDPTFVEDVSGLYWPSVCALFVGLALSLASLPLAHALIQRVDSGVRHSLQNQSPPTANQSDANAPAADATQSIIQRVKGRVVKTSDELVGSLYDENGAPKDNFVRVGVAVAAVLAVGILGAFLIFPSTMSALVGTLGTITLLLGSLFTTLSAAALFLSRRKALDIFRLVNVRFTPLVTLLIVVPIIAAQLGGSIQLHALNNESGVALGTDRATIATRFDSWLTANAGCDVAVPGTQSRVVPMVLVAAEGGGIRAATWTIDGYNALSAGGTCAESSVLLSSGVSGGSVGMTIVRANSEGEFDKNKGLTDKSLAIGVAGLFVGDVVGALTGIRVPTTDVSSEGDANRSWHDRAEQIQNSWASEISQLGGAYSYTVTQPTGAVILNSTDTLSRCKVLVSQLDLNDKVTNSDYAGTDSTVSCAGSRAEQAGSIDLRDYYGSCPYSFDWATASMLSARFPIVTPAARVSQDQFSISCSLKGDLQLVDGGYIDNSGLGTISNLAPELTRVVLEHNRTVAAGGAYVVPIVVYLHNRSGDDLAASATNPLPELAVPVASILTAPGLQTTPASWFSRIANTFDGVCPAVDNGTDSACEIALAGVRNIMTDGIVVVAPSTGPSVGVPLGWSLSDMSRLHLQAEMDAQAEYTQSDELLRRNPDGTDVAGARNSLTHGFLGDLLALMKKD